MLHIHEQILKFWVTSYEMTDISQEALHAFLHKKLQRNSLNIHWTEINFRTNVEQKKTHFICGTFFSNLTILGPNQ
jgi:hypothetical protein